MSHEENVDDAVFKVVVDHEEQYSIWPADRENALGWNDAGKIGTRQECDDFIKKAVKDRRPGREKEKEHGHEEGGGGVRGDL